MNFKGLKRILLLAVCLVIVLSAIPAQAIIPYSTYTYDIDGNYVESPHAYVPYEVISSQTLGLETPIANPYDMCTGRSTYMYNGVKTFCWDRMMYISDGDNARVIAVKFNEETNTFDFAYELKDFVNDWGVPDSISSPRGLYATDTELYVCDTDNNRILVFATEGNTEYAEGDFIRIIAEPESEVFPDDHIYKPIAVAVSSSGYTYVVSSTTYQGIISLNSDGEFAGFIGTQSQSLTLMDMIWRRFQTAEQKNKSTKNVSTEFNNLNINEKGFIFASTASISEDDMLKAINAKSTASDYAPVKMLNPNGEDVMKRSGFYPPSGEINVNMAITPDYSITGTSTVTDVALGPEGTWSLIDSKREKVFTYDEDGNLLFAFGDKGSQLGNITGIQAIDYAYDNRDEENAFNYLMILDKENDTVTVYKRTEYGDVLVKALKNQRDRNFDLAANDWNDILQRNSNFDMSYIGIGKSLSRQGHYKEAMDYFEHAYDTTNYSDAYQQVRKQWIEKFAYVVPVVVVLFFVILSKIFKYAKKVNDAGLKLRKKRSLKEEFMYGFYSMCHPFDGYWDIKHEYRASTKGATFILALVIVTYMYSVIGKAYILDPHPTVVQPLMMIVSILLPVFLWVIANWCLTTLFDGEGSMRDIYIATCYSLFPLPAFFVITTLLSNVVTLNEASILSLAMGVAYAWVGFLLFFGMMVIHDYSLFKNLLTTLASIVGMAFIMFIAVLFSSLLGKIVSFIYSIVIELSYRM